MVPSKLGEQDLVGVAPAQGNAGAADNEDQPIESDGSLSNKNLKKKEKSPHQPKGKNVAISTQSDYFDQGKD